MTVSDMIAGPDAIISVREVFGIDTDLQCPGFRERTDYVPALDPAYRFDPDTTLAVIAGFMHNRRVLVQGFHGTGKLSLIHI